MIAIEADIRISGGGNRYHGPRVLRQLRPILMIALLATSATAQLQLDDKGYGPYTMAPMSFNSITVNQPTFSQWVAGESTSFRITENWNLPSPMGAVFTMSEAGAASAVTPTLAEQAYGLWNGTVVPTAGPPQTLYFWKESFTWTTAANGSNPVQYGPLSKQNTFNDQKIHLPQAWSSSPTTISRMQPFDDVTAVPEPSTIGGTGVLLAFVAVHFFRLRRKQNASA